MALVVIVDQITKIMAVPALATLFDGQYYPTRRIQVIPQCLDFMYAENTGGAFSILQNQPWIITSVAAVILVGIIIWSISLRAAPFIVQLALGMVIGGAIGNLIDRVRLQYVIDFIHAYIVIEGKEHAWPTFNVADMAIMGGMGVLLYLGFFTKILDSEKRKHKAPDNTEAIPNS